MNRKKLLVVGDVFLDRYYDGPAVRLSPEAPVPVVSCPDGWRDHPGGAANVAATAADLGAASGVLGAVGNDPDAGWMGVALDDRGVWHDLVLTDRRTPIKVRVTAGGRHLARADVEDTRVPYPHPFFATLWERFERVRQEAGVVVLSDYAKGCLPEHFVKSVIGRCRSTGVPVLADPKPQSLVHYNGCLAVTPNWREALEGCRPLFHLRGGFPPTFTEGDDASARTLAIMVADVLPDTSHVVITRGAHGCTWFDRERDRVQHMPAAVPYAVDVTGAGDVFVAGLAAGLLEGSRFGRAVELANAAAGLSVTRFGTGPLDRDAVDDLADVGTRRLAVAAGCQYAAQVLTAEEAAEWVARRQKRGERVVFTNGCFDVLHPGHMRVLRGARAFGERLVVGVNSDASVTKLKGAGRPVHGVDDRVEVLATMNLVDVVVVFDEDTPEKLVRLLKPNVLVKGAEYKGKLVAGADYVASRGGRVEFIDMLPGHSTTRLVSGD